MRVAKTIAVAASLVAVLTVGTAAYRLAGIGGQVEATARTFGDLPRPRRLAGAPPPVSTVRPGPAVEPGRVRNPPNRFEQERYTVTDTIQRNDLDYVEQMATYSDDLPVLGGNDSELKSAFDELLNDPDPEVRREAKELLEAWTFD